MELRRVSERFEDDPWSFAAMARFMDICCALAFDVFMFLASFHKPIDSKNLTTSLCGSFGPAGACSLGLAEAEADVGLLPGILELRGVLSGNSCSPLELRGLLPTPEVEDKFRLSCGGGDDGLRLRPEDDVASLGSPVLPAVVSVVPCDKGRSSMSTLSSNSCFGLACWEPADSPGSMLASACSSSRKEGKVS